MNKSQEAKLISKVLVDNNHHAFEKLVQQHQSQIRNYARRLTKNDHAFADDLAQETFMLAFEKLKTYSGVGSFAGWLLKICYRLFLLQIKKNHFDLQTEVPDVEYFDNTDVMVLLEQAFKTITYQERSAITLNTTFGYTHDEVAEIMQLPLGTVKSHITRGKTKLQKTLESQSNRGAA